MYKTCEGIRRVFLAAQRQIAAVRCVCVSQTAAIRLSSRYFTTHKVEAAMLVPYMPLAANAAPELHRPADRRKVSL